MIKILNCILLYVWIWQKENLLNIVFIYTLLFTFDIQVWHLIFRISISVKWNIILCHYEYCTWLSFLKQLDDYTGVYNITLIPCLTPVYEAYTLDTPCHPESPISFSLPIQFQQISNPVPAEYTLNTDLSLTRKRDQWISEKPLKYGHKLGSSFAPGNFKIHHY